MDESKNVPEKGRIYQIVLVGILSMFFAEVCSGASVLWFFNAWSLLVTFPLYWAHILFFITLAIKTKRTTLSHLYLWGVLFGLYESWITKVVWAGYFSSPPLIPPIFGFAAVETIVIVLFWHPIFSFIIPILVFEILAINTNRELSGSTLKNIIIPSHVGYIIKTRGNSAKAFAIVFIGSTFLLANSGFNIISSLITLIGTFVILYAVLKIGQHKAKFFSIYSLKLQRRGFTIVTIYLIMLYLVTFPLLRPEAIPPLPTLLLTLCFYGVIIFLLYIYKPVPEDDTTLKKKSELFSFKDIKKWTVAFIVVIVVESILIFIVPILFMITYLSFIVIGLLLFVSVIIKIKVSMSSREE